MFGFVCWLGFAAPTSYATAIFSGKPAQLWLIDSAYNLVSFVLAGAILGIGDSTIFVQTIRRREMMSKSRLHWRPTIAAAAMILGAASIAGGQKADASKGTAKGKTTHAPGHFRAIAPDLASKGRIALPHVFNGMGCNGQNISPALQWSNPPVGTKSFAVTMYDPDAPTGSGWWHWVMYNIPAATTGLPDGAGNGRNAPSGSAQGMTDFGTKGYGGPCPPVGDKPHHYHITVFALKVDKLDVPGNATSAMIGYNLNANKLGTARLTGLYGR